MCGIVGMLNVDSAPVDIAALLSANDQMVHRGPDDSGYYSNGPFAMAMRRLSIIGINNGRQPLSNEDASIYLVLNGEIYNHIELRQELIAKGHRFTTDSDAEVLVHLYEEHGLSSVTRLNGMFAFALWDNNKKRLWLCRDRLGIKPLVYHITDKGIAFASTLSALTRLPGVDKEIDQESLMLYLGLSYVPSPRSIFKGVRKLAPGSELVCENGQIKSSVYWRINPDRVSHTENDLAADIDSLITDSIRLRSRSDVEVGTFLSGGIDSSTVTAYYCRNQPGKVHTYLADFAGKESEKKYAEMVAHKYRTTDHTVHLSYESAMHDLDELIAYLDEPIADTAIIPSYAISKTARSHGLKVMLSGAGGDEIFGGYERYYTSGKKRIIGKLPILNYMPKYVAQLNPGILHYALMLANKSLYFALSTSGVNLGVTKYLYRNKLEYANYLNIIKETFRFYDDRCNKLDQAYGGMLTDINNYLVDNVLSIQDKTSMASSIEARVPLLDHRLVEKMFMVSSELSLSPCFSNAKKMLKMAVNNKVPSAIIQRQKMGFNGPLNYWVCNNPNYFIDYIKNNRNPVLDSVLCIDKFLYKCKSISFLNRAAETLFAVFIFNKWYQKHVY